MFYFLVKAMKKLSTLVSALILGYGSTLGAADTVFDAIKSGKPTVQIRLRYESVDTDPTTDVYGVLARTAIGYKTGSYEGFSAYVQVEDVSTLAGDDGFSDPSAPARLPGPTIADPEKADVNMSYLKYDNGSLTVVAGRQTIIHDKSRHIGNVGWRMDDQTYDAMTVKYKKDEFSLSLSHVWQVNRIFGTEDDTDSNLLHGTYDSSIGLFSVYYYQLDFESTNGGGHGYPAYGDVVDTDTYGIRLSGKYKAFSYTAEYASQSDGADNTLTPFETEYLHANVGYDISGVMVSVGYESMGSDNSGAVSFATPLGTVHAFNGWSDRNLSLAPGLNGAGIVDTYLTIGGKVAGVKLLGTYRQLENDVDTGAGKDRGTETNLLAVYKTKPGIVLGAKAALYEDDTAAGIDTTKTWFWTEYKF
jgi:hypothetical protein